MRDGSERKRRQNNSEVGVVKGHVNRRETKKKKPSVEIDMTRDPSKYVKVPLCEECLTLEIWHKSKGATCDLYQIFSIEGE